MTLFAILGVCLNDECGFKILLRKTEVIFFVVAKLSFRTKVDRYRLKALKNVAAAV